MKKIGCGKGHRWRERSPLWQEMQEKGKGIPQCLLKRRWGSRKSIERAAEEVEEETKGEHLILWRGLPKEDRCLLFSAQKGVAEPCFSQTSFARYQTKVSLACCGTLQERVQLLKF